MSGPKEPTPARPRGTCGRACRWEHGWKSKNTIWGWLIPRVYGDFGEGLLLAFPEQFPLSLDVQVRL